MRLKYDRLKTRRAEERRTLREKYSGLKTRYNELKRRMASLATAPPRPAATARQRLTPVAGQIRKHGGHAGVSASKEGCRRAWRFKSQYPLQFAEIFSAIIRGGGPLYQLSTHQSGCVARYKKTPSDVDSKKKKKNFAATRSLDEKWNYAIPTRMREVGVPSRSFLASTVIAAQAADAEPRDGDEASHLCHHRWCINPAHVVAESRSRNNRRRQCQGAASCICGNAMKCVIVSSSDLEDEEKWDKPIHLIIETDL